MQRVIFSIATTFAGTRAALTAAIPFARGTGARLVLLVPHVVPFPLSIDSPVDPTRWPAERYRALLRDLHGDGQVRVCLCRNANDVIGGMLPPHATIVIGGPTGSWLTSREERLAHRLVHQGHHVVFVPIEVLAQAVPEESWATQ